MKKSLKSDIEMDSIRKYLLHGDEECNDQKCHCNILASSNCEEADCQCNKESMTVSSSVYLAKYICTCGSEKINIFHIYGKPYRTECRSCEKKQKIIDFSEDLS